MSRYTNYKGTTFVETLVVSWKLDVGMEYVWLFQGCLLEAL